MSDSTTLSADDIRWPAEWEPQAATWIAWPHNLETWPNRFAPIPGAFRRFIGLLSEVQPVHVLSGPAEAEPSAAQMLRGMRNVTIHHISTNDSWIRDYGPTFVTAGEGAGLVGIDWRYNAWGGKYPPFDRDAAASEAICRILGCSHVRSKLHCEGGAIEGDGTGALLTTSSCLRNPNRNAGWLPNQIEQELERRLGVKKVIWVDGGGLQGDDTDGHIDQLARFVGVGVVVVATSNHQEDPNYKGLQANARLLGAATNAVGAKLQVHKLPTPPARFVDGVRVPESYCNFLLANGIVLVPTFRHAASDQAAVELLGDLFPERSVIGLDAHDLAWGLGAFHCASQQQPAV